MLIDQIIDRFSEDTQWRRIATRRSRALFGSSAEIYLIDEPSAYLDSEQRIVAAKVIKRYVLHRRNRVYCGTRLLIMATYLADRVVVMREPSGVCRANSPQSF